MTPPDPSSNSPSSHEKPTVMASSSSNLGAGDLSVGGLSHAAADYSGKQLGEYKLLDLIGTGGGGAVFRARHDRMDRLVAVKIIAPRAMQDTDAVRRFEREVRAAAKLMHPHIVTAFDAGEQDGIHYLVMELVEGPPLSKLVEQKGPLPIPTALKYLLQVAKALRYAHSRDVIHRDIKPSNILVDTEDNVKVLDMGLARLHTLAPPASHEHLTQIGVVMGTVGYISPEQAMSAGDVDHRADIYSLGCTLYFLLTGRSVFTGNFMQALMAHLSESPPSLADHCPGVSPLLEATFRQMLAKKPEARQQSMAEVIEAFESCLGEYSNSAGLGVGQRSIESRLTRMLRDTVQSQERLSTVVHSALTLALDVGTTQSSAAAVGLDHRLVTIPSARGQAATPSLVSYEDERIVVGCRAADTFAEGRSTPATDIRRWLGENAFPRPLSGQSFPPEVLLACLYHHLHDNARHRAGEVHRALLTVPACFDDLRRRAVLCAAKLAGIEALGLVDEPTAAALLWSFRKHLDPQDQRRVLVYRLGGGSFDASVFEVSGRHTRQLATAGDAHLGGTDWDQRLAEAVMRQMPRDPQQPAGLPAPARLALQRLCEQAKRTLSDFDRTPLHGQLGGRTINAMVSREWFASLTSDLLERTRTLADRAVVEAGLSWSSLDHVIPVGGMTRLPMVHNLLWQLARRQPEAMGWGDDAIARGAALFASQALPRGADQAAAWQVDRCTTGDLATLGFDPQGQRRVGVLIRRNTPLPAVYRRLFRTRRDGQTTLVAQLVQGDATQPETCTPIGNYSVHLPRGLPAETAVELQFTITVNGLVEVSVEPASGTFPVSLEITRPNAMTAEDLGVWQDWLEPLFLCEGTEDEAPPS